MLILLAVIMWVAVKRIGLGAMDVLLVYAVGAYAVQQQRWNRSSRGGLLGEESEPPMRWGDGGRAGGAESVDRTAAAALAAAAAAEIATSMSEAGGDDLVEEPLLPLDAVLDELENANHA